MRNEPSEGCLHDRNVIVAFLADFLPLIFDLRFASVSCHLIHLIGCEIRRGPASSRPGNVQVQPLPIIGMKVPIRGAIDETAGCNFVKQMESHKREPGGRRATPHKSRMNDERAWPKFIALQARP
jgi:hypothetical protein